MTGIPTKVQRIDGISTIKAMEVLSKRNKAPAVEFQAFIKRWGSYVRSTRNFPGAYSPNLEVAMFSFYAFILHT